MVQCVDVKIILPRSSLLRNQRQKNYETDENRLKTDLEM